MDRTSRGLALIGVLTRWRRVASVSYRHVEASRRLKKTFFLRKFVSRWRYRAEQCRWVRLRLDHNNVMRSHRCLERWRRTRKRKLFCAIFSMKATKAVERTVFYRLKQYGDLADEAMSTIQRGVRTRILAMSFKRWIKRTKHEIKIKAKVELFTLLRTHRGTSLAKYLQSSE